MKREHVRQDQWIYNLLVHGFHSPASRSPGDKVKAFRQERLKHMVLSTLFEDYDGSAYRKMDRDARRV